MKGIVRAFWRRSLEKSHISVFSFDVRIFGKSILSCKIFHVCVWHTSLHKPNKLTEITFFAA